MSMEQIIDAVRDLDGALVVIPGPGSDAPELAWGDAFFYYAPDGVMPQHVQPYGTIVTKDYPDDTASELDAPGRWRVNVHVDRATFRRLTGEEPRSLTRAATMRPPMCSTRIRCTARSAGSPSSTPASRPPRPCCGCCATRMPPRVPVSSGDRRRARGRRRASEGFRMPQAVPDVGGRTSPGPPQRCGDREPAGGHRERPP